MFMQIIRLSPFRIAFGLSLAMGGAFISNVVVAQEVPAVRQTGLELGNNLNHVSLTGHVRITCQDYFVGTSTDFDCSKDTLEPFTYSRFQTATAMDADHFDLKVAHEHGWSRYKSGEYVPSAGTSDVSLNLWNSSIFDLPILNDGVNQATYQLSKQGKVISQGAFIVNVAHITRACRSGVVTSHDAGDCRIRQYACDRYFLENNDCQ